MRLTVLIALLALAAAPEADAQVPDPGGGASWTASVSQTRSGQTCARLRRGRVEKGRYCAPISSRRPFFYAVRYEQGSDPQQWRSVFVILMARNVESATLTTVEGARRYRRGRGPRVLLVVLAGRLEQPPLVVRARIGRRLVVVRGGRPPAAEIADPAGAPSWRAVAERRSRRRICVTWERAAPRFGGPTGSPSDGPFRCGNPAKRLAVAATDRVAGRVVVWGVVGPRTRGVLLRGPGDTPIAFDPSSRTFIAVLPGDVVLDQLTLIADGRDGLDVERRLG